MTHFIGAVIVPANIDTTLQRVKNTRYDFVWIDPDSPELQEYLKVALAPFDESVEADIWHSREELIASSRADVQAYENGYQRTAFKQDPFGYALDHADNPAHIRYVAEEFPRKLSWTDEEHYQHAIRYAGEGDVRESDGALHDTYNPDSKWDWWTIGGRWDDEYRDRQGETVANLLSQIRQTRADITDPDNVAELARVNAEIEKVQEDLANKVSGVTWQDLGAAKAKRLECKGYVPWWFPFHIVAPSGDSFEWHQQGQMGWFGVKSDEMDEVSWLDKLEEVLASVNPDDKLVFIDFHI